MKLVKFSIDRPISTIMILLFFVIIGLFSFLRLPLSLTPNIDIPTIVVSTVYPNSAPIDVLENITKPLEEVLNTVPDITVIKSTSEKNLSKIILEFDWNTDLDLASLEIREKINSTILPDEAKKPELYRISSASQPIMRFDLYGDYPINKIRLIAEDVLKANFEQIKGVGKVEVKGGYEECLRVICNPYKLSSKKITIFDVIDKISAWKKNVQVGKLKIKNFENTIVVTGRVKDLSTLKKLLIKNNIKLYQIAEVKYDVKEVTNFSRVNGISSVSISVKKNSFGNAIEIIGKIKEITAKYKKQYSKLNFFVSKDDSVYINASQEVVKSNLYSGAFFVTIVLLIFLRSIKSTLIIGLSIPISLISTFMLLYFSGVTRNIISMAGLALGIGMTLDSSIVILENIYRYVKSGMPAKEAALSGTSEVGLSVIASNLTSIAVFFPILFLSGLASKLFTDLALAVIYSLIFSLFVGLMLVPMLAANFFKNDKFQKKNKLFKFIDDLIVFVGDLFVKLYVFLLKVVLGIKLSKKMFWNFLYKMFIVAVIIFVCVYSIERFPERIFLPEGNIKEYVINVELPSNYSLEQTNKLLKSIEKQIKSDIVEVIATSAELTKGEIFIKLKENLSKNNESKFLEKLKRISNDFKYGNLFFSKVSKINLSSTKIEFSVGNDNQKILHKSAKRIKEYIDENENVILTELHGLKRVRETSILVNKQKLNENKISTKYISDYIFSIINGSKLTNFFVENKNFDIIVEGKKENIFSHNNLMAYPVQTGYNKIKKIGEFISLRDVEQYKELNRTNLNNVITVESIIDHKTSTGKMLKFFENKVLSRFYDLNIYWYGTAKNTKESFRQLGLSMLFAVILIYIIMSSQFESFVQPFIIMFSLPLILIGVSFGLNLLNLNLGVSATIGIIMLSGIVVNNAIILVDYLNILRFRGIPKDKAIFEVGSKRLRPIAITTITTVVGMIPLAISKGAGAELYKGCAVVVIFGLLSSTLLTLLVVPLIYSIFDDILDFVNLILFRIQMFFEMRKMKNFNDDLE